MIINHFKRVMIALSIMIALVLSASAAMAANIDKRAEVKEKAKEMRGQGTTTPAICSDLSARIDARISRFEMLYKKHASLYVQHEEKLLRISTKLAAKGISDDRLRGDIAVLGSKIGSFESQKEEVFASLEAVKDSSCAQSDGEFRAAVQTVRDAQKELAKQAKDIREFIRTTLKQDIIDLRSAAAAQASVTLPI